jgi:hypothetical protein
MSCCGSLFVNLGGGGGGTVNTGVLQTPTALSATLQVVEDQNGTDSVLSLSNKFAKINANSLGFGNGGVIIGGLNGNLGGIWGASLTPDASNYSFLAGTTTYLNCTAEIALEKAGTRFATFNQNAFDFGGSPITNNGVLTVKGGGSNIVSCRNSSNVERLLLTDAGNLTISDGFFANFGSFASGSSGLKIGSGYRLKNPADGVAMFQNDAASSFDRIILGANSTDHPAIAATNTPPALAAKDATGTSLIPFSAEDFKSANLSAGTLNTARPMQFGDKGTVTTGNDLGLDAQIAVEHNGNVYYIPCSTVLLT